MLKGGIDSLKVLSVTMIEFGNRIVGGHRSAIVREAGRRLVLAFFYQGSECLTEPLKRPLGLYGVARELDDVPGKKDEEADRAEPAEQRRVQGSERGHVLGESVEE